MGFILQLFSYICVILFWFVIPAISAQINWKHEILSLNRSLESQDFINEKNCAEIILSRTNKLSFLDADDLKPTSQREEMELINNGKNYLNEFVTLRIRLKEHFDQFTTITPQCLTALRRAFRFSYFAEDYLAEWLIDHSLIDRQPRSILDGEFQNIYTSNNKINILPGDIMIMRGPGFTSSFLTRAGDEEGVFSHLAIVGVDQNDGKLYVIESLIESGVIITPLDKYLERTTESRVTIVRHKNKKIGKKAGIIAFKFFEPSGIDENRFSYNIKLDLNDEKRFYCSQVARKVYSLATNGKQIIPQYLTDLYSFKKNIIARSLNIHANNIFSPSDIEFDNRFYIVGEYRNPALVTETRIATVTMSSLIKWINKGYTFQDNSYLEIVAKIVSLIYFIKNNDDFVLDKTAQILLKVRNLFDQLNKIASKQDNNFKESNRIAPTFYQLTKLLEDIRIHDCLSYIHNNYSRFGLHEAITPPRGGCFNY